MTLSAPRLVTGCGAALVCAACGGDVASEGDRGDGGEGTGTQEPHRGAFEGGSDGGGPEAGLAPGGTIRFRGNVSTIRVGSVQPEPPARGVDVCAVDGLGVPLRSIPCVSTGPSGEFVLGGLPIYSDAIVSFGMLGVATMAVAVDVEGTDIGRAPPVRFALQRGNPGGWDPAVPDDASKGLVSVVAVQPSTSPDAGTAAPGFDFATGVSFELVEGEGIGPYYIDPAEAWVPGATATAGGWGAWFVNLPPGQVRIRASHRTMSCIPAAGNSFGWGQSDGTMKAPSIAGMHTQAIAFFCSP